MMITEDFTFPIVVSNDVVHLTVLPPLWRISSINHSNIAELGQENGRKRRILTSFSQVDGEIKKRGDCNAAENDEKAEGDEKMDMLWEDFNEELQGRIASSVESSSSDSETHHHRHDNNSGEEFETAQECYNNAHEFKIPKKKLVVKVLKKLFLLQNMATIKKRGPN